MNISFTAPERARLRAAYEKTRADSRCAHVLDAARKRGFRLATVEEREFNDGDYIYSWRGTLWVRLDAVREERKT